MDEDNRNVNNWRKMSKNRENETGDNKTHSDLGHGAIHKSMDKY